MAANQIKLGDRRMRRAADDDRADIYQMARFWALARADAKNQSPAGIEQQGSGQ